MEALRSELTELRRAAHDRVRGDRERELAAADARERQLAEAAAAIEADRQRRSGAADLAAPGRPSVFPPDIAPGTTEHARALLGPGRRILIDGYNVAMTVRGDLAGPLAQRQWLEQACAGLADRRGVLPEVFWDGDGPSGSGERRRGGLVIHFSPAGIDADDDLVFAVEAAQPDEPLVVVTDDRELRERLQPYRVDLLATQPFGWALRS